MYQRNIAHRVSALMDVHPVVLLGGARQSGKSTLVRALVDSGLDAEYVTLDDPVPLAAAAGDPDAFVAGLPDRAIIDEVQRAPGLFRAIKRAVDRDRRPGRFLLTGSADVMLLPGAAEYLAGRMGVATLWPLSQGELRGVRETFIDRVFERGASGWRAKPSERAALVDAVLRGGFPPAVDAASEFARNEWLDAYAGLLLQREVSSIANVERLGDLARLLVYLATRAGTLANMADVSRALGMPKTTVVRYVSLLEAAYAIGFVPSWAADPGRRHVKAPKVVPTDSGLTARLMRVDAARLAVDPNAFGPLLESFVVMELRKQATWADTEVRVHHYRTPDGREVDVVLEDARGRVVGIEVKAAAGLGASDTTGLGALRARLAERFVAGVVLHDAPGATVLGDRVVSLPVSALWQSHA